ncbi:MAG: hypothetical protein K8R02_03860 [Anaerohalosphaeraceae bacterium]|nr:hypothetical protein [Anaerohalosphaeraceae bacterium]
MRDSEKQKFQNACQKKTSDYLNLHADIIESLPLGIVVFDKSLKILASNSLARQLIDVEATIDESLAKGSNQKIWGDWGKTLKKSISTDKPCRFDSVAYASGENERLLQITVSPLYNNDSRKIVGGIAAFENITEKTNIQKHLATTERLAALGKLASKVAHELNNPIDGMMRYLNLAKRAINQRDFEKPIDYLEHTQQGLERMTHIIAELLEFSKNKTSSFGSNHLDEIIDEAKRTLQHQADICEVDIICDYPRPLPLIKSTAMFQVFINLIKNSINVMPDGGTVTISCKVLPEKIILIKIRDSGPGFAPENSDAIFEPFFTTKPYGKGTGLGLAVCKDIIEKYGGKIIAENLPGSGCVFTIHLPINE